MRDKFHLIFIFITISHFLFGSGLIVSAHQENELDSLNYVKESLVDKGKFIEAAQLLIRIGDIYEANEQFMLSQSCYLESLELQESHQGPIDLKIITFRYLGIIVSRQEFYNWSIDYHEKALELATEVKDQVNIAKIKNDLGVAYNYLDSLDQSTSLLSQAFELKIGLNKQSDNEGLPFREASIANTLHNWGWALEKNGQFEEALLKLHQAANMRKTLGRQADLALGYNNIGYTFLRMKNYDSAEYYLQMSRNMAEELKQVHLSNKVYSNLGELYNKMGTPLKAYQYLQMHDTLRERLYNERVFKMGQELLLDYEMDKKDRTINKQKDLISTYSLVIALLFIIAIFIVLYFYQRQKNLRQLRLNEKMLFDQRIDQMLHEGEMNTMNAMITGRENERIRIAEDLHDRLGSMLAGLKLHFNAARSRSEIPSTLVIADELLNQTIDETRKIAHNLYSGVLSKFGLVAALHDLRDIIISSKEVSLEIDVFNLKDRLSSDLEVDLYRISQELISNSLKHAKAKNITVQLTRHQNQLLSLLVEDDGRGFNSTLKYTGMGMKNVKNRISKYNGEINIDSTAGRGTTITIEVSINGSVDGED